jgi:hypothetical protein
MPLARRGILTGGAAGVGLVVSGSVPSLPRPGRSGTAVFDARRGRLRLIQNHELPAGSTLGVPHVPGTVEAHLAAFGRLPWAARRQ